MPAVGKLTSSTDNAMTVRRKHLYGDADHVMSETVHIKEETELLPVKTEPCEACINTGLTLTDHQVACLTDPEVCIKRQTRIMHETEPQLCIKTEPLVPVTANKVCLKTEPTEAFAEQSQVCLKEPALAYEVCSNAEPNNGCVTKEPTLYVKEEPHCEDSVSGVGLCTYHIVKEEILLGPEESHQQRVTSNEAIADITRRSCSVRLERLLVTSDYGQVGLRIYKLNTTRETPTKSTDTSRKYQCNDCGKCFRSKSVMRRHIQNHSVSKRSFKAKPAKPKKRIIAIHTGEKVFQCDTCEFKCNDKSSLRYHERIHTGKKYFQCSYCDYKCSQMTHLRYHLAMHAGEMHYQCSLCDFKCIQKPNLLRHQKLHTGEKTFQCTDCDYKSRRKDNLKRHLITHTGEKPFRCSYCDYKSKRHDHLQQHLKLHSGVKPFRCTRCKYASVRKDHLSSHLKSCKKKSSSNIK